MVSSEDRSRASQEKSRGAFLMSGRRNGVPIIMLILLVLATVLLLFWIPYIGISMDPLPHADFGIRQRPYKRAA